MKITFSTENKPLGTCGPVKLLEKELTEPFILMNGDILTTLDFQRAYQHADGLDSLLMVVTTEIWTPFDFGNVLCEGDYIRDVQEKPHLKMEILAGIYVLKPAIFDLIPADTYFGIDALIKHMLAKHLPVGRYLMKEYWLDIGRIDDYEEAQDIYREHFNHLKK